MTKHLIIDCQLLQTKTWHRGMGKYSAKLLEALLSGIDNNEYTKVTLLFNQHLKYDADVKAFVGSLKGAQPVFMELYVPKDDPHSITIAQRKNQKILDTYVAENLPTDQIYFTIASLFLDEACPVFPTHAHKSVIFYDLIPLMYYKLYLGLGASEQYFTRFSVLFEADAYLAISETVANDLVSYIGVPKDKIFNIRGASNWIGNDQVSSKPKLTLDHPYILMPTGGDPRKNNLNGVIGFDRFNRQNNYKYQLVITSIFTDAQKTELHKYSGNILFTDNVSDAELCWLYEHAEVVLFPTEYEGLGMPVLEAIDADKLIVCSDIPVFREISSEAFFTFDPRDPESIGNALEEAIVAGSEEIKLKKKHYKSIQEIFTWHNSALEVLRALNITQRSGGSVAKRRIAFVTPNISYDSELSRYAALNYASLAKVYDIDFYYDMSDALPAVRPNFLGFVTNIFDIRDLAGGASAYDLIVYFIEDEIVSKDTIEVAASIPGLIITGNSGVAEHLPGKRVAFSGDGNGLLVTANQLAFPLHKPGLDNCIFVCLNNRRDDDRWNIDYIKDIASVVDKSKAMFTVVTKARFSDEARNELAYANVSLYEDVADHEYNVLLTSCDLFVDARPGESFDKLFALAEASANELTVFAGAMGDSLSVSDKYSVAQDGKMLRDMTYRWLMRDLDTKAVDAEHEAHEHGLKPVIDEMMSNKEDVDARS